LITTNHKTDGIYLPEDDRRHYVAWSNWTKEQFADEYWNKLWSWYAAGGFGHVAAYLTELDLTQFDAKAPPPKTAAFWDIVAAGTAPEDAELADVLDSMGNPAAVTLEQLIDKSAGVEISDWLMDRKNRRAIPHRMERCGYAQVRNPDADDGRWKLQGRRQTVYAKISLSVRDQIIAARGLASRADLIVSHAASIPARSVTITWSNVRSGSRPRCEKRECFVSDVSNADSVGC
jgi:hypothetical protein